MKFGDFITLEDDDRWEKASDGTWFQPWDSRSEEERAYLTAEAWDRWIVVSCVESNGGHAWWLDWDEEDGVWLHCQHCPSGVDDLYPDGQDLIYADLELADGQVLRIDCGSAPLYPPVGEWHGPVRAFVREESFYSWEYGAREYSAWVVVEAA